MAERNTEDDSSTGLEQPSLATQDFELILTRNYRLFAIIGVFGALSVYLFDLRGGTPNLYIDWGVAGALFMFLVASLALIYKITYQIANYEKRGVTFRAFTAVILIGLLAVMGGILGVVSEFLSEIFVLGSLASSIVIYTMYLNWFPWDRFRDIDEVSDDAESKIREAHSIANLWIVVTILVIGALIPRVPKIAGQDGYVVVLLILGVLPLHLGLSLALKRWYIFRDRKTSDKLGS